MGWVVVSLLVVHGLIHLLGVAKGWGWAEVAQLQEPISAAVAWAWLGAATLVVLTAALIAAGVRWWWLVGACAALTSQAVIATSWSDARAGTAMNLLLLIAVGYGFASLGPMSLRAEYRSRVDTALSSTTSAPDSAPVTATDLAALPAPVSRYLRRVGTVGKPPVLSARAVLHGRIRSAPDQPWMSFTGEQVNTYGPDGDWTRTFFLDATKSGLPVDVLHTFVGDEARMRVRVASLVPMTDEHGPEFRRAETVTLFNDLALLAPGALVGAPITWTAVDEGHVIGTFTHRGVTVGAHLFFDDDGDLVDFVSQDRLRSVDGGGLTSQSWSTPVTDYETFEGRRAFTHGEGRWRAPPPEGDFAYLELSVDDLSYNVG